MPAPRILLADDDADTAAAYEFLLRRSGYRTDTAADGPTALARVLELSPDLLLLDLGLPGMDGFEVLRRLRADPRTSGTVVLVVSGYAFPGDLERARQLGSAAVLTKPCDPDDLCRAVAALVGPPADTPPGRRELRPVIRSAPSKPRRRAAVADPAPTPNLQSLMLRADFLTRHAGGLRREAADLVARARAIRRGSSRPAAASF